jgi:catechol 2,3-dioxygenase-like lactoylglutathione lyase family enzyme
METDASIQFEGFPTFARLHHISLPCRDIKETIDFYCGVLGGTVKHEEEKFVLLTLGDVDFGLSTVGVSWTAVEAEYPHTAFEVDANAMLHIQHVLDEHNIPYSNCWTRKGIEALMFFRDPSDNVLELFCLEGYPGAKDLPQTVTSFGHGVVLDVEEIVYDEWKRPST